MTYASSIIQIAAEIAASRDRGFSFSLDGVSPNFATPAAGHALNSFASTVGGQLSLDSTPEPSSWVLMIGGLGVIGAVLRRRRPVGPSSFDRHPR